MKRLFSICRAIFGAELGRLFGFYSCLHPLILHLTTNSNCNLRCAMCKMWTTPPDLVPQRALDNIVRSKKARSISILDLTGGEPFLIDLPTVLAALTTLKLTRIYISTNGVLTDRITQQVKKIFLQYSGKLHLFISLDGIGEAHDQIRGVAGTYKRVMATLTEMREMMLTEKRLEVSLKFTLLPLNIDQMLAVHSLAREYGFGFTMKPFIHSAILKNEPNEGFTKDEILSIEANVKTITSIGTPAKRRGLFETISGAVNDIFHYEMVDFLWDEKGKHRGSRMDCYSSFISIMVHSDGKAYSCPTLMKLVGDLNFETLDQVWRSQAIDAARRLITGGQCACMTQCDQFPSIVMNKKWALIKNMFLGHRTDAKLPAKTF